MSGSGSSATSASRPVSTATGSIEFHPTDRPATDDPRHVDYDVAVIGAGPAGLSASLNLVRARRRTIVFDSNRPRNAATFHSHGFMTRDGISPLELRKLARQELEEYPHYEFHQTMVVSVTKSDDAFLVSTKGPGFEKHEYRSRTIVIATGVTEVMPALPTLRAFYGTSIHSVIEANGYEERDKPLAVIGETDDLAERAILLSQWSDDIIVFTNGIGVVSDADVAELERRGIRIDRRPLADVAGDQTGLTGIVTVDGPTVPRRAAFVRPRYEPKLDYIASLGLATDAEGFLLVDDRGRTSAQGVYAAGDPTLPGPQQLIVAAGAGATVATTLNMDLLRRR